MRARNDWQISKPSFHARPNMLRHKCGFRSENKSVSIRVFKENSAEAGPLAKERKGWRKCQRKSLEKVKASDEDTKPSGRRFPMARI